MIENTISTSGDIASNIEQDSITKDSNLVPASILERLWKIFFRFILALGIVSALYYYVATPYSVVGDPLPIFSNSNFVLSEKVSYLIWEPAVGDIVIFGDKSMPKIGVVSYIVGQEGQRDYQIISTPNQQNLSHANFKQIIGKVYFPTRYGKSAISAPQQLSPSPSISPSPSPLPVDPINPKTGQKISTWDSMGFSFEYPPTWIDKVYYLSSPDDKIRIDGGSAATGFTCMDVVKKYQKNIDSHNVQFTHYQGVKESENCDDNSSSRLIVSKFSVNKEDYILTYAYDASNQLEAEKFFDQIAPSFKFDENNLHYQLKSTMLDVSYSTSQYDVSKDKFRVTIDKLDGDYARGTTAIYWPDARVENPWFAAYHDGQWRQVWAGKEPPSCALMDEWKFPKSIFQCSE